MCRVTKDPAGLVRDHLRWFHKRKAEVRAVWVFGFPLASPTPHHLLSFAPNPSGTFRRRRYPAQAIRLRPRRGVAGLTRSAAGGCPIKEAARLGGLCCVRVLR